MNNANILIVEDEVLLAQSIERFLRRFGYTSISSVTRGEDALACVATSPPDLILMDIKLRNKIDGIETAERILKEQFIPIIYLTAYSDAATIQRAKRTEPFAYLSKPVNEQELRINIEMALYKAQVDRKLRESEERYALALRGADLGTWDWNILTDAIVVNERWATMLGYAPDEIEPNIHTWKSLLHPDDRQRVLQALQDHLEARTSCYEAEHRLRHKTGKWVWILSKGQVISRDASGRAVRMCGTHLDITERKQAEAIRSARLRLMEHAATASLEELLRATIDESEALTESSVGFYHFLEPDQQTLSLQAWSTNTIKNLCQAVGQGLHYSVRDAGVWVDCIYEKKPVIHNDYASLPHRKGMPAGHVPVIRELVVPVIRKGQVVAVLGVGNKSAPYDDDDAKVVSSMADLAWDIAEKKRLEIALAHSERVLRTLINASCDIAILFDTQHRIVALNSVAAAHYNTTGEEMIGRDGLAPLSPHVAEHRRAMLETVVKTGEPLRIEDEHEGRIFENYCVPIKDNDGRVYQIALFARDITDAKTAAEKILQAEERYRAMFEGTRNAIAVYRAVRDGEDFVFVDFNTTAERIEQITRDKVIGRSVCDVFPGVKDFGLFEVFQRVWRTGTAEYLPVKLYKDNRISGWRDNYIFKLPTGEVVAIYSDETAHMQAEEEQNRLAAAIQQAQEAIVIADPDGIIQYVNPAFERITGYSPLEAIGQNPRILKSGVHDNRFYEELWQTITSGRTWQGHFVNRRKDGSLYDEEASIAPVKNSQGDIINFVAVKRDITNELRLEEQLRQAQKMEALGTLAGGIAHDFNNILAGILNYAQIGLDDPGDSTSVQESFTWIMKLCDRAADMVKQILAFSRQTGRTKKLVHLQSIVNESLKLLRSTIPANVEVYTSIDPQTWPVCADLTQMHQVLINLCSNAPFAMRRKGGRIEIRLANYTIREPHPDFPKLKPGDYVQLSVSDTGTGIEPELLPRIFEPYFTTKKSGEGIGMGLAMVHGIVADHGGAIAVQSVLGKGSTFTVLLPRAEVAASETSTEEHPVPCGSEHILLIDDEQALLDSISIMLKKLGYSVTACASATGALELFKNDPDAFQLVLTNQTMPQMTGNLLAQEMTRLRPDLPVILMTGYSSLIDTETCRQFGVRKLIIKPIHIDVLAREIRKAIEG